MTRPRPVAGFRCLEIKTRAQEEIYQQIKDLSPAKQREYFRNAVEDGPLAHWWRSLKRTPEPRPHVLS